MTVYDSMTTDWRTEIPESRRRWLRRWYWSIAFITLCVLIVGGVTRLTHSGLSMVEWQPILGVIPPVTEADWQHRFEQYQQFPEYQKLRQGMTLHEFKFIFFWEYLHRILARAIGMVFLIPFVFFLVRRWMNPPLVKRSLALFGLGAAQGLMGWLMVASGLVDRPSVSHYRLAAHLSLAFLIFGYAVWLARDMRAKAISDARTDAATAYRRGLTIVGILLAAQIIWGAFVAGLKAGFFANTFPLMGGRLVPQTLLQRQPALSNFVANPVAVQWTHRLLGTVLAIAIIALFFRTRTSTDERSRNFATALLIVTLVQYVLGVLTLIYAVPVALGVAHQAVALILFGTWVMWLHHVMRGSRS